MSPAGATITPMQSGMLIGLAVLAIGVLGLLLFLASAPLLWYLAAAALFFSGLLGPAFGCLLLGILVHALRQRHSQSA